MTHNTDTAACVPVALLLDAARDHPYRLLPLEFLLVLGETSAQVRVQLPAGTPRLYHPARLCPVGDATAQATLTAAYSAWQAALTAFAGAITALGRYDQQVRAAGGVSSLTPWTPTVIQVSDPTTTAVDRCYNALHVPTPIRFQALEQTAKMVRIRPLAGATTTWAVKQTGIFCCPDEAAWVAIQAARAAAVEQSHAWQAALHAPGAYPHQRPAPQPHPLIRPAAG